MGDLSILPAGGRATRALCVGSVQDVIAGHFPRTLEGKRVRSEEYRYGFLLGSPKDKASLGETVIVNNTCYTTSTDPKSDAYNKTIYGPTLLTSGVFLLPKDACPSHKVSLQKGPIQVTKLYEEIFQTIDHPLAFVGLVQFAEFHATVIGKSPIDEHNIFLHEKEYYPFPPIESKNVKAFIIGVLTDFSQEKHKKLNKELERVLYRSPHAEDTSLLQITSHAHVLTLKESVSNIRDITPQTVDKVLHVVPEKSTIAVAQLDVFTLSGVE